MGSANNTMTGVFQSIRLKEMFYQTVSEKTRLQIEEMHTAPKRGDASLNSPDPLDAYIPSNGGNDSSESRVNSKESDLVDLSDVEGLALARGEPLGQNLDFAA